MSLFQVQLMTSLLWESEGIKSSGLFEKNDFWMEGIPKAEEVKKKKSEILHFHDLFFHE